MRPKILFICGSLNQTTQLHQIAQYLPEYDHAYTPYYCDGFLEWCRRLGWLEFTVIGDKLRKRCFEYYSKHGLTLDLHGQRGDYALVVTCTDLIIQKNIRSRPIVVVQEGIFDPPSFGLSLWRRFPWLPLWVAGTATTGLSGAYERFCAASPGYRDDLLRQGVPPERVVVTGMPNFDDCRRYEKNSFPHRGYVLACTSDARETFKGDDRRTFIANVVRVAAGRPIVFKLHPNENVRRAAREIERGAPDALVFATGCAEEMVANCDVLLTQYSSLTFVGLALGKEVHSYFDRADLGRLMPVQNGGRAAENIAAVCRESLERPLREAAPAAFAPVAAAAEAS